MTKVYWNDGTRIPFGKYKGEKLANIPASYLVFLYDNVNLQSELFEYIDSQIDELRTEALNENPNDKK